MNVNIETNRAAMRRRGSLSLFLAAGALWVFASEAQAQIGFAVEGRAAVTVPQGDLSDRGAETGLGLGVELQANFRPNLTAYVALHRHAFGCEDNCSLGNDPRTMGLGAGLKLIVHNPGDVLVWGRGGVVTSEFSTDSGSFDREIGFELGAGADMPIGARLYLVPNVGFMSHAAGNNITARFFTAGLGVHYHIN